MVEARSPRLLVLLLILSVGCSAEPIELTVDVRTDYLPLGDFDLVETELSRTPFDPSQPAGPDALPMAVRISDDFFRGSRVAEIGDAPSGRSFVRVRLKHRGAIIAQRVVDLKLDQSYALTVVMTRSCREVTCPRPGDPAEHTACLNGECVDPRCTPATPEYCGEAVCEDDADCAGGGCAGATCVRGACLCGAPTMTDAGPRDAGSSECTPGETAMETSACGECGEGTQTRTRTCEMGTEFGVWGAWSDWGACTTSATCSPGQTDTQMDACGNCGSGTRTRSRGCDGATCTWGAFGEWSSCMGQSGCSPGSTTGCPNGDSCGHRVCRADCTWSGCQPIYECLRIRPGTSGPPGNNYRCCGSSRWQFCLPSCYWSTDCALCSGCGC